MSNQIENNTLTLESQKKISMTGVDSVDGFSEQYINLTVSGKRVKITGENIKITSFNKQSGTLSADGLFFEIKYGSKKKPILKRILK